MLPKGVCIKGQLSIPRAELNAARDLAEQVLQLEADLDISNLHPSKYFTDSLDVLAWINNVKDATKRYVTSRINTIRKISQPSQWHYIQNSRKPGRYWHTTNYRGRTAKINVVQWSTIPNPRRTNPTTKPHHNPYCNSHVRCNNQILLSTQHKMRNRRDIHRFDVERDVGKYPERKEPTQHQEGVP